MIRNLLTVSLACLALAGCAASGKAGKNESVAGPENPQVAALAAQRKRESKERPPVKIGPDIIVEKDVSLVWPLLIKVEDWGSWMSKVTKVEPGAGLSPGALVKWQWEEKPLESEIVDVKENELFAFRGAASSKKAVVKWALKTVGPKRTLISLRAEVPYGTASETMDKLGREMNDWITALQAAVAKAKPAEAEEE
jgi:hypothetical protein